MFASTKDRNILKTDKNQDIYSYFKNKSKVALVVIPRTHEPFGKIAKLQQKTASELPRSTQSTIESVLTTVVSRMLRHSSMKKTITYDNGSENTEHEKVNITLRIKSYFCNPYLKLGKKELLQNTIGLVRRILPKKTDFAIIDKEQIKKIEILLNFSSTQMSQLSNSIRSFRKVSVALSG